MKKILTVLLFVASVHLTAQTVLDYKTKNAGNENERTEMLDAIRNVCIKEGYPEFKFVVSHLKVKDSYAFFKGTALNKDGSSYHTSRQEDDCCHVEAVFEKKNGHWVVFQSAIFAGDVWYACLWKQHQLPKEIFDYTEACEW